MTLPTNLAAELLLEGRAGERLIGDSAVLMPVWNAWVEDPHRRLDLLLTPLDTEPAARVARLIHDHAGQSVRGLLPLQGTIAVEVDFPTFVGTILPLTGIDLAAAMADLADLAESLAAEPLPGGADLDAEADLLRGQSDPDGESRVEIPLGDGRDRLLDLRRAFSLVMGPSGMPAALREALLVAMIEAERRMPGQAEPRRQIRQSLKRGRARDVELPDILFGSDRRVRLGAVAPDEAIEPKRMIWRVSRNRPVEPMMLSVTTIKADAALRLFELDCRDICWAVIDSGIDGSHPAFRDHESGDFSIRVDRAYDFTRLRRYASYDSLAAGPAREAIVTEVAAQLKIGPDQALAWLTRLGEDAEAGRPHDWEALSALIEVAPDRLPADDGDRAEKHGTHVAGVLAGDWRENGEQVFRGVCPNLRLYDLRVLASTAEDTEVAVIAALEFVRWLNGRNRYITIHGVNLSIGLEFDMENYACGQTPVCTACDTTVASGVSVVVAAGNWGSRRYRSDDGDFRGYAPISIADPGNAESVITVGATHRERPHEYGVSFFSSRGPTGDGRQKPDVVAPGERIDGPLPDLGLGQLDGTSMAAPHVSGVAAMLMARFPELIGRPQRIKQAIVGTATDLGRERAFQGAGLVDALRALQSL